MRLHRNKKATAASKPTLALWDAAQRLISVTRPGTTFNLTASGPPSASTLSSRSWSAAGTGAASSEQPAAQSDDGGGTANDSNAGSGRVSERKCKEYSRGVMQRVDFIPLVPEPDAQTISAANCNYTGVELIVGGEVAEQGEFPHMAAIGWANDEGGYTFGCGGSVISPKFVLTAGHCTWQPRAREPAPVIVRLGDQNLDPAVKDGASPIEVPIKATHRHPDYQPPKRYNDIALLELAADVDFEGSIRPACLWPSPDFGGHERALATGWGATHSDNKKPSKELQKVSLTLLENDLCDQLLQNAKNRLWTGFVPSQMCAGELRGGKDTCQGDSGSPLQVSSSDNQCVFYVMGVTSFGRECAQSGQPAIYTRVSSYLDWIESVVGRASDLHIG
ncbi:unnamed protein product, partial [Iphiclides podalirius]